MFVERVIDTCCNFFFVPSLRDPDGPLLILTAKLWKHGCMIWRPAAYKVQNETNSNDYTNPALKLVLFTKKTAGFEVGHFFVPSRFKPSGPNILSSKSMMKETSACA
jgi:hypothetical protein